MEMLASKQDEARRTPLIAWLFLTDPRDSSASRFLHGQNKKPYIFSAELMGLFESCPDTLSPQSV